jgi:hypothetical protein
MKDPELDPASRHLGECGENGAVAATAAPKGARILDHHVLEIGGRDPDAPVSRENRLHDRLVVLAVAEEA